MKNLVCDLRSNLAKYPDMDYISLPRGVVNTLLDLGEGRGCETCSAKTFAHVRVLADENASLQKRNDVLDKALLRREKNAINAIVHEATQSKQFEQLQADLTCRSEQYRQDTALIQVQREEITARDTRIAELEETLSAKDRQFDRTVIDINIEHDCEKGSWMGLVADKEEGIVALTERLSAVEEENIGLRKEITCVNRQTYDSGRTLLGLEDYQLRTNIEAKDKEIARLQDALESLVHFNCCADCALGLKLRFAKQALEVRE